MSVGPVDNNASTWQYTPPTAGAQSSNWQEVLAAASSTLGESTSTIQQQLQSGSSLGSIASAQGVSQQSLVSAIADGLQQSQGTSGSTAPSTAQLQQIATNLVNGTGGHHHHHHHGGGGGALESSTDGTGGGSTSAATGASDSSSDDDAFLAALTGSSSPTDPSSLLSALLGGSVSGSDPSSGSLTPAQGDDTTAFNEIL